MGIPSPTVHALLNPSRIAVRQVRFIALLREPAERMHSAYWFWPQYRRRYGKHERGFLEYSRHVVSAFRTCLRDFATPGATGGSSGAAPWGALCGV